MIPKLKRFCRKLFWFFGVFAVFLQIHIYAPTGPLPDGRQENERMKKTIARILVCAAAALVAACGPSKTYQNINYMQDITEDTVLSMKSSEGILVQPKDMISIVVSHRDPELAAMFNLTNVSYQAGGETRNTGTYRLMGYSVDNHGDIDFPILGKLHVAGMNRWAVAQTVKDELESRNLLRDAVVSVEFMNFQVSVIGEVVRPGTYTVSGDKINILEALSLAGDMTIFGRRDNVTVTREENGKRHIYVLDLRNSAIYDSPAYYLRQNDIIYVTPNKVRAGQSTINENNFRSVSFWTSLSATALTVINLIITITKK